MASALSENPASVIHSLNLAHNTLDNQGSVPESVNSFSLPLPSLSGRCWLFSCSGFCLRSKNSKSIPVLTEPSFFCFALYFSFSLFLFSSIFHTARLWVLLLFGENAFIFSLAHSTPCKLLWTLAFSLYMNTHKDTYIWIAHAFASVI